MDLKESQKTCMVNRVWGRSIGWQGQICGVGVGGDAGFVENEEEGKNWGLSHK